MPAPLVVRDITGDLITLLDEYAASSGMNRSAAVRTLLYTSLGDTAQQAAIREAIAATANLVRPIINAQVSQMHDRIAEDLTALLNRLGE